MKKLTQLAYVFILLFFGPISQAQITPLLELSFDSNTNDARQEVKDIVPTNITFAMDRYGKENAAVQFNGKNSFIKIPFDINPDKLEKMTVIFWAKTDIDKRNMTLFSHDNAGYDRSLVVDNRDKGRKWAAFCGSGGVLGGKPIIKNSWTFVAGVFDQAAGEVTLFVNGETFRKKGIFKEGLPYFHLGSNPKFGGFFSGEMDDFRLYNQAVPMDTIKSIYEKESQNLYTPIEELQTYYSTEDKRAEVVVRVGDIDNLGFGWPQNFNPFCGEKTKVHSFPWAINSLDYAGTDRIMVGSSYQETEKRMDGYTRRTKRSENQPIPIVLTFPKPEIEIKAAVLQMFVDDFQSPVFRSSFQFTLDGKRISYIEDIINSIRQTGPIGKLINLGLLKQDLALLEDGKLEIFIDDPQTGVGDGFAIDFVQLLINPNDQNLECTGTIKGIVKVKSGALLKNAIVSSGGITETTTDETGSFLLENVPAGLANINARKMNYEPESKMVDLGNNQTKTVTLILKKRMGETSEYIISELGAKGAVDLYGIYFETGKDTPKSTSNASLESLLQALKADPNLKVTIGGHTDSDGEKDFNQKLSERRANAVVTWLNGRGISSSRLSAKGFGEISPIANNQTEEGKSLNRRVEVIIKKE